MELSSECWQNAGCRKKYQRRYKYKVAFIYSPENAQAHI
jgi:hypothetical protein